MDGKGPITYPSHRAVRPDDAIFFIVGRRHLFGERCLKDALPVIGVNRLQPGSR